MKQTLLKTAYLRLLAAVVLFGILCAGNSNAQTFKIAGSKYIKLGSVSSYGSVEIDGVSGQTDTLKVTVLNPVPNDLSLLAYEAGREDSVRSTLLLVPDSTGNTRAEIIYGYYSPVRTSETALVILTNSDASETDTIVFSMDPSSGSPDSLIVAPLGPVTLYLGPNSSSAGATFTLSHIVNGSLPVLVVLSSDANGHFKADPTVSVPAPSQGSATAQVTYSSDVRWFGYDDSVIVTFRPEDKTTPSVSVTIYVVDTTKDDEHISTGYVSFMNVPSGKQECGAMKITNNNPNPCTIVSMSFDATDTMFSFSQKPSLPLTIDAYSTVDIGVCYKAPDAFNQQNKNQITILYTFDGGSTVSTIHQGVTGTSGSCVLVTRDSVLFGDAIYGGYTEATVTLTNETSETLTFTGGSYPWSYPGTDTWFTTTQTYPFTLEAGASKVITFRFTPPSSGKGPSQQYTAGYVFAYTGSGDSLCDGASVSFEGLPIDPSDTSALQLFPSQTETLPLSSEHDTATKTFVFVNNAQTAIKVTGVAVKDGTHFSVISPMQSDLPITLQPSGQLNVSVLFDASSGGFYSDDLIITTDHALASRTFSLQAIRTGTASVDVADQVERVVSITPNPAISSATIRLGGIQKPTIEIYDLLGNRIASESGNSNWTWDITSSGVSAAVGSYFVRVSGYDSTGRQFVQTERLVVTK